MKQYATILLVLIGFSLAQPPYSTCWNSDSDCPSVCPTGSNGTEHFNTALALFDMTHNKDYVLNMVKAQGIIKKYSPHEIIRFDQPIIFHTSLNYFCCYSAQEKLEIMKVLLKYEGQELRVNWTQTWCNVDHTGKTIYIHADASEESQKVLFNFVKSIEADIEKLGIKIWNPRVQKFHSTLVRVTPAYPTDVVTKAISDAIPVFGQTYSNKFIVL